MDWSKAKSILIVAFIVTNLLLGYVLFIDGRNVDATTKDEFIQDAIKLLNNKDIELAVEIPKIKPSLYGLTVEYEMINADTIVQNYFSGEGIVNSKDIDFIQVSNKNEHVTIVNRKLLIYESDTLDEKYDIEDEEHAIKVALDFLYDRKYDTSDMKLSYSKYEKGIYYLEYSKVYNDAYLESSFTNIQVDNTGVRKLERTWLNVKETGETPIYISSAPKSILGLLSMENVYGKVIKDISLCYYFEPLKHDYLENPSEAKQGKAVPAWRIQFEDGYKVFLDNYS